MAGGKLRDRRRGQACAKRASPWGLVVRQPGDRGLEPDSRLGEVTHARGKRGAQRVPLGAGKAHRIVRLFERFELALHPRHRRWISGDGSRLTKVGIRRIAAPQIVDSRPVDPAARPGFLRSVAHDLLADCTLSTIQRDRRQPLVHDAQRAQARRRSNPVRMGVRTPARGLEARAIDHRSERIVIDEASSVRPDTGGHGQAQGRPCETAMLGVPSPLGSDRNRLHSSPHVPRRLDAELLSLARDHFMNMLALLL